MSTILAAFMLTLMSLFDLCAASPTRSALSRRSVPVIDGGFCRFSGFEWVGWRNTSADGALEMTFGFDEVRNFSEVIVHTNNNRREEIEVGGIASVHAWLAGTTCW